MSSNFYPSGIFQKNFVLNEGSKLLNVDGSVTPVVFTYGPGPGARFSLRRTEVNLTTTGNVNLLATKFLDLPGLTNGLLLGYNLNGTDYFQVNMQNNWDLMSELNVSFDLKVMGQYSLMTGAVDSDPLVLDGDKGDFISVTVRDDLSGLEECALNLSGTFEPFNP